MFKYKASGSNGQPLTISNVTKVAVLRANALGDFIFVLPALNAIKETYTEAELVYLGKAWHKEFMSNRPGPVDRVIAIPKCNGIPEEYDRVENEETVKNFFQQMQEERFDIAFQMHGGGRNSNPFLLNLNAKVTVGLKTPDAVALDLNIPYTVYHNEVLRYLEVVASVGAKVKSIVPSIQSISSDQKELEEVINIKKPYVVIHPGASSIKRRWPPEKFAQVADVLYEKGYSIYITGSLAEQEISDTMQASMKLRTESLVGKLSIKALTALLGNATLVVSSDTGPLHLARALDVPTVGIYLGVNLIMAGPIIVTKHRTCISWICNCPICGASFSSDDFNKPSGKCRHEVSFLTEIPSEEVIENCLELIRL
jgi:ADP-heptose:LPS heptosyltransferase